jgi:hypothetical protein
MENKITILIRHLLFVLTILMLETNISPAQIAPYSLPPKWFFGHRAGMDFTGGAPVSMAGNVWDGASYSNQEGSTTECLPNGNVLYYSNSCVLANGSNVNFGPSPVTNGGGNSSTQGCVAIPNPANPSTSFYYITTQVDPSGGSDCIPQNNPGVWIYPITSAAAIGAPTQLTTPVGVGECIAACSDNADGYKIISHAIDGSGNTTFYIWSISNTGAITVAPTNFSGTVNGVNWKYQSGIKINKCNNRIAFLSNNGFEVRNWSAGTIGALIRSNTSLGMGLSYGVEFSPDGNILYMTDFNGSLYWYNIATGAGPTVISASNSGSGSSQGPGYGNLILGPDDKIYLSNRYSPADAPAGGKYLAVINNPNGTIATPAGVGFAQTGAGAFALAAPSTQYPSTAGGVITLGWHNPFLTIAGSATPTCESFSYTYTQYYGATIAVVAGSEQWDFGDGNTATGPTPTHGYASTGTYTVTLSVKDQLCSQTYTSKKSVVVSCAAAPVDLISFEAVKNGSGVLLSWVTATELNNDHFDIEYSTDGIHYITIGAVKGNGNSSTILDYSYVHNNPSSGINYYRLVQYDFNGHKDISTVKSVSIEGVQVTIVPNPSSQNFNVHISGADHVEIIVTDVLGREVYRIKPQDLGTAISFGSDLEKGAYTAKVITGNDVQALKIIKE